MKLKHGKNFVKKTGSTWRLLFVFALFPWLRQYRILGDEEVTDIEEQHNEEDYHDGDSSSSMMDKNTENALKLKIYSLNEKVARLTEMNKSLITSKRFLG
jgi:hypothetical protein